MSHPEPRSMTLVDAMALVAGVAAALASIARMPSPVFLMSISDPVVVYSWEAERFGHGTALAVSMVVAARVIRYRRLPRLAEWLGILTGLILFSNWPEELIARWLYSDAMIESYSFIALGWIKGVLFLAAAAIGLSVIRLGCGLFPAWLKTTLLVVVALLLHGGPFREFGYRAADLLAPPGEFGTSAAANLYREGCGLAAWVPMALFFGVPSLGVLAQRSRRQPWAWTEWVAVSSSVITMVAYATLDGRWVFDFSSGYFAGNWPAWMRAIERVMVLAWLISIALTSKLMFNRFTPVWRSWIGEADDQARGSTSDAPPSASHF